MPGGRRRTGDWGKISDAGKQAGEIYAKYGAFTTAASVIASWAVIQATFGKPQA